MAWGVSGRVIEVCEELRKRKIAPFNVGNLLMKSNCFDYIVSVAFKLCLVRYLLSVSQFTAVITVIQQSICTLAQQTYCKAINNSIFC